MRKPEASAASSSRWTRCARICKTNLRPLVHGCPRAGCPRRSCSWLRHAHDLSVTRRCQLLRASTCWRARIAIDSLSLERRISASQHDGRRCRRRAIGFATPSPLLLRAHPSSSGPQGQPSGSAASSATAALLRAPPPPRRAASTFASLMSCARYSGSGATAAASARRPRAPTARAQSRDSIQNSSPAQPPPSRCSSARIHPEHSSPAHAEQRASTHTAPTCDLHGTRTT
mmetsp:Transcript_11524/g.34128  ORF Transcript_11524/g.34128 Transcript_11524/m.34128 type:complete len:230 (-) Transcript_11524:186-875(-)